MVVFPNCKINLGLQILDQRPDGYHNLETVFYPVPLKDALEAIRNPDPHPTEALLFSQSGLPVSGDAAANLCVKAWHLLKKDFPDLPPLRLHLHKLIPMGAGLGGGSADGAFTLNLLNQLFGLQLSAEQRIGYALQLGSDCPFFILNRPCFARGRGELLDPLPLSLRGWHLVLVNPGIHISTAWAFTALKQSRTAGRSLQLREAILQPPDQWRGLIRNDFEPLVLQAHPELNHLLNSLYDAGAVYAAMSGSGSTFFGLFRTAPDRLPGFPPHWMLKILAAEF